MSTGRDTTGEGNGTTGEGSGTTGEGSGTEEGDELEREKLLEFSSSEGQEELFTYCNRPRRTIMEVRVQPRACYDLVL